jgi:hypothetical protein
MAAVALMGACALAWAGSRRLRSTRLDTIVKAPIEEHAQNEANAVPPPPAPLRAPSDPTLRVPRVTGAFPINAETEGKTVWEGDVGNTHDLLDDGGRGMVPYTEAKARWGNGKLYFLLYAGDLDLEGTVEKHDGPVEKDDAFRLEFGAGDVVRVVDVSVLGTVADSLCKGADGGRTCDVGWQSHAEVAVDRDGTLNHVGDNDEEWVVEMAIPLSSLGLAKATGGTRIPFSVRRCEVGFDGVHACGQWGKGSHGGELLLEP